MKNHSRVTRRVMPIVTMLGLLFGPAPAPAQTLTNYVWSNTNGGAWSDVLSWTLLPGAPVSASNTVLSFSASGSNAYTATNDLAAPFMLNRLFFTNTSGNGAISLTGGALQFQAAGTNTPQILLNSNGAAFIANDLVFDTNVTVGGAGGGLLTFAGGISGLGGIVKTGTNTLVLAGSNSFSDAVTISNGVVRAQNSFALGTSNVTVISGAALELTNNLSIANPLLTINGTGVGNAGALRNRGDTNLINGNLALAGSARINSDAGLLVLNSAAPITGAGFTLTVGGAGNTLINSAIGTTTGGLTKDGAGTLTLAGSNTYTGTTLVTLGTLMLAANDALSDTGAVTVNGGTLNLAAQSDIVGVVTLQSGTIAGTTGTLTGAVFSVQAGAVTAQLGGSGGLFKSGAGTVTLAGSNSYAGATVISNGVLSITHSAALGATSGGVIVSNGAALELTNNVAVGAEALTLAGGGIGNAGALRNRGGTNSYSGDLVILTNSRINTDAGLLVLNSSNAITGAGFTLTVGGASNTLIASSIATGAGGLLKDGAGTLTLTVSNSFAGAVTVSNGVLSIADGFALGTPAGGVTVISNAALELTNNLSVSAETLALNGFGITNGGALRNRGGTNTYSGAITFGAPVRIASDAGLLILDSTNAILGAGRTVTVGGAGDVFIASVINTSTLTKTNGGTLTLTASNVYTGGTVLNGGVVAVMGDAALGAAAGTLSFAGGTLRTLTNLTSARAVTLNTGGGTFDSGGFDSTLSGVISGGNSFTKVGSGTLTLSGNNTYGAAARTNFINGGTLSVNASARLGSTSGGIAINSNAVLEFTGSTVQTRVMTVGTNSGGGGGVSVTGTNLVTQTGTLTGGTFTKLGTGYLIVTNNNAGRSGTNIVAGGVLQNDSINALGGGPFLLLPGGTFSSGSIGVFTNNLTLAGGTLGGTLGVLGAGGSNRLFTGAITVTADSFISTRDQRDPTTNVDLVINGLLTGGANLTVTG
ncbi:MAG: autotransporter-associated beta strand repeat-containing protein [Verrucomicrobia bacterium]|nr:autotransporter-associated beta strand repeat-containing protein [Verrucomicrobiota bacterium]